MRAARLQQALERLTAAIRDVESELEAMKREHDPLASHIFVSRRHYRNANDTKGGKRREMNAGLSFNTACELNPSALSSSKQLFQLAPAGESSLKPLLRNNWGRPSEHEATNPKHQQGSIRLAASQRRHKGRHNS